VEALCRITLLEPYRGDPGFVVPLHDGQRSLVPMGGVGSISDPSMHVGFNSGQASLLAGLGIQGEQNRFKAAQNVVYELGLGPERSIMIPVTCAHFHFGDWTIKPGDLSQRGIKRTYAQERIRVAMAWGDWTRMPRGRKTNNGVVPDTRCIAAPNVPRVSIAVLEQNGVPYGDAFEPWAFYRWETDIDSSAVVEAQAIARETGMFAPTAAAPNFDLSTLTPEMLDALAALVAAKNGGNGGKTRPRDGA
jgi:hypothetical protein